MNIFAILLLGDCTHLLLGDLKSLCEEKSLKSLLLGDCTLLLRLLLAAAAAATRLVRSCEAGEGDLYLERRQLYYSYIKYGHKRLKSIFFVPTQKSQLHLKKDPWTSMCLEPY